MALKDSLLLLLNLMKEHHFSPNFMDKIDITSFYKGKGPRDDFYSDRGIFKLNLIRSIKEKMLYNDIYDEIDSSMSDSNVGGRKQRSIRNHLWILYTVIHESLSKKEEVEVIFYDLYKCFDT